MLLLLGITMTQTNHDNPEQLPRPTPKRVPLREITESIGLQSDEVTAYLNLKTGEVIPVAEESVMAAENGEDTCPLTGVPLDEVRAIMAGDGYVALPDFREANEYGMMEQFASSIDNRAGSDSLFAALQGRRPFRRFKDAVHRMGLAESWYKFRDAEYTVIAADWCEYHGIPYDR